MKACTPPVWEQFCLLPRAETDTLLGIISCLLSEVMQAECFLHAKGHLVNTDINIKGKIGLRLQVVAMEVGQSWEGAAHMHLHRRRSHPDEWSPSPSSGTCQL